MIEAQDLVKTYRLGEIKVQALRSVNLKIEQGEMTTIMGPSGSGKSTLMHLLGCLDKPTSGLYKLDGVNVGKLSDNELARIRNKKIGFVFQGFNLLPRTSALENVQLPLLYSRGSKRRESALEMLNRVGLGERASHEPSELSGGEQQRVAIARALVNKPSIILADEPTGNVDSKAGEQILEIFKEINLRDGVTILVVTHDPEVAGRTRRILHLRDGELTREENHELT